MSILRKRLETGEPYFIAEMSANHANKLEIALEIVDKAAESGADCLKVQTYTPDTITLDCDNEWFTIHGGLWDGRRLYDLYKDASFPWEWHEAVKDRCLEHGIDFLSTPFDETAVDYLDNLGCNAYKIASFELVHIPLIEYAAAKGKAMIMSTGMATLDEIKEAIDACRRVGNNDVILLHCCSDYPANPSDMHLSTIVDMARRLDLPIGFSDHSEGHLADIVAASLGARVFEKHFCLSKSIDTADVKFSMTPEEFADMVRAVKTTLTAIGKPLYGALPSEEHNLAYRRSIFASDSIECGDIFTKENIRVVRPAFGASPRYYNMLLGTPSPKTYAFGDPIVVE